MNKLKAIGVFVFLYAITSLGGAQKNYWLQVYEWNNEDTLFLWKEKYSSTITRDKALSAFLYEVQNKGFLAASIDSIARVDSFTINAYLYRGEKFKWAFIQSGNVKPQFLTKSSFREKFYYQEPIRFKQIVQLQKNILQQYENNGYPFAVVKLRDVQSNGNELSASLFVDSGEEIIIDSVVVEGNARIAPKYLQSYIGVKVGKPYDESAIRKMEVYLDALPFLSVERRPVITFTKGKAVVRLFLRKENANQFSGVLGIVPSNDLNQNFLITGDVKIRLQNMLSRGELIDLQWQRLQKATQELNVVLNYPFLFNLPIGVGAGVDFYRIDTAFYNVNVQASVHYLMRGDDHIKLFYNFQTSRKILNEEGISTQIGLANTDIHYYGLGIRLQRLDYPLNPRKGFALKSEAAVGVKNVFRTPSDSLNPIDTTNLKSVIGRITLSFEGFIPFAKRFTIRLATDAAYLPAQQLFRNELFRIGGLKSIKGFDESSIYASLYSYGTFEMRFLIDKLSYVNVFGNAGYYERNLSNQYYNSWIVGFGAGLTFGTKIGFFTINYALGAEKQNTIDFKRSKIHFGYINRF